MNTVIRKITTQLSPFTDRSAARENGQWPAKWIACGDRGGKTIVCAYRLILQIDEAIDARIHVSADQRYELFVDGERAGRGPERGDLCNWFYESHQLTLGPGRHVLVARVWTLEQPPMAQMSWQHAFVLAAEAPHTELLSTGVAPWDALRLDAYGPVFQTVAKLVGQGICIDGREYPWGVEHGAGDGWHSAVTIMPARDRLNRAGELNSPVLRPGMLPAMLETTRQVGTVRLVDAPATAETPQIAVDLKQTLPDEQARWQRMLQDGAAAAVTVPPNSRRRVIVDLERYYCAYTRLTVSKGLAARIRVYWAESLYHSDYRNKQNRDLIDGKYFMGRGDAFISDGGERRTFSGLWWNAGRYLELYVETHDEPLVIESVAIAETRYPLEMSGTLSLGDERFNRSVTPMYRTLQMCSHETYVDCPYYEQLMYAGDTRLEMLVTYATSWDDRLPRKAIALFDASRWHNGLTQGRYPSAKAQIIPQFSLWWIAMLYDFAMWRGDEGFVRQFLPGMRAVVDRFLAWLDADGRLEVPEGWNWVDWAWRHGEPPMGENGYSAINHWQLVLVLGMVAELERWIGDRTLADRCERVRGALARSTCERCWDEQRGLFADTPERTSFSEQCQCYALLSGQLDPSRADRVARSLLSDPDLTRATIYFQHYLFEVCQQHGRTDVILDRMQLWYGLADLGLKTTVESPEPARSDCHAWGSHPIFHAYASILGIRPARFGFDEVVIKPQLGPLQHARGSMPHPRGFIGVELSRKAGCLTAEIRLPEGVSGTFIWNGIAHPVRASSGSAKFCLPDVVKEDR